MQKEKRKKKKENNKLTFILFFSIIMYRKSILSAYRRNVALATRNNHNESSVVMLSSGIKNQKQTFHSNYLLARHNSYLLRDEFALAAAQPLLINIKYFHSNKGSVRKDPESKAEQTANLLKDQIIHSPPDSQKQAVDSSNQIKSIQSTTEVRLSLWGRIVKELKHYYNGFKLLYFETKIATGLLIHILQGFFIFF